MRNNFDILRVKEGLHRLSGTTTCCERAFSLDVPSKETFQFHQTGSVMAFASLDPAHRELLISGTCDECWKDMFNGI